MRPLIIAIVLLALCGCGTQTVDPPVETTVWTATPAPEPAVTVSVTTAAPTEPPTPEPTVRPEPPDSEFVLVSDFIEEIEVELKYATEDNFVGEVIYEFDEAWLRYGTVKKLAAAQEELAALGYGLKIWDAFRPSAAQFTLWNKVPDSRYVANPNTGYSSHSTGNTVDITLVDADGNELEMPTGFDDFSSLADRDYWDVSQTAAENARLLEDAMARAGFTPYYAEWWHYSDTVYYGVETEFSP